MCKQEGAVIWILRLDVVYKLMVQSWLCKYLCKHDCANNCTIIQLWIIHAFSIYLWLCDLNNHDCAICTIIIVQFAQSWLCNLHNHNCAIFLYIHHGTLFTKPHKFLQLFTLRVSWLHRWLHNKDFPNGCKFMCS